MNPLTRTARVKKPTTIKVRRQQLKPSVFPGRAKTKVYRRKKPIVDLTPLEKKVLKSAPQYSQLFAKKKIKYVAAIMCHGISCDEAKHMICESLMQCENPLFKTEYDVVFTTKYGQPTEVYGNTEKVSSYLCEKLDKKHTMTGEEFMGILESTVDREAIELDGGKTRGIGGALGKNTILTQKNSGSMVADLKIFMEGEHTVNDNDGIFLFEIGEKCTNVLDHNALTVDPSELIKRRPGLHYVAQAAQNLQSLIEPTGAKLYPQTSKYGPHILWSDVTYQLKEFKDDMDEEKRLVRLSDILEKKGIFPEGTVVIPYVCRSTLVDDMCARSPSPADYMTYMSDAIMSAKSELSINTPKTSRSQGKSKSKSKSQSDSESDSDSDSDSDSQKMSVNSNPSSVDMPNTPQKPASAQSVDSWNSFNSWHSWGSKYGGGLKINKKGKTLKKRRS